MRKTFKLGLSFQMKHAKAVKIGLIAFLAIGMASCTSIRQAAGNVTDALLVDDSGGIDNQ